LQDPIEHNQKAKGNPISESQFNLLYALYAFPNVVIPLLGGMLIDRIGARWVLIIAAVFCVIGHFIFGFGGYENSFAVMLAGRVVFGIGG
jgi:MFS family permease